MPKKQTPPKQAASKDAPPIKQKRAARKRPVKAGSPKAARAIAPVLFGLVALCILLSSLLIGLLSDPQPKWGITQAPATPSPTPEPTPQSILLTPAPTAVPLNIAAPKSNAAAIMSKGTTLLVVESDEAARQLLETYLQYAAYEGLEANEWLIRAAYAQELSLSPAQEGANALSYDEAYLALVQDPTRIPVTRTIARCSVVSAEREAVSAVSDALPVGSRLLTLGCPDTVLVYTETVERGGRELSATETNRFPVQVGTAASVTLGTYTSKHPNEEPGRNEGETGPTLSTKPERPINGKIRSYFGMRRGTMHNGVDYEATANARIVAPADGVVIYCGERGAYGFVIDILHDEGGFVSRLTHCSNINVELWQRVEKGATVAYLKGDENVKTTFHYELLINGIPYNPLRYIS